MAKQYKQGDKIVMNDTFSRGSKYANYAGKQGRVCYVNNRQGSYDIEFKGTNDRINYVSPKMFRSADELATPEQKRDALRKSLVGRRKDAEAVIDEKKAFIEQMNSRLTYLTNTPDITEIDETAFLAWRIASAVQSEMDTVVNFEAAGGAPLSKGEFGKLISNKVYDLLKTTNK